MHESRYFKCAHCGQLIGRKCSSRFVVYKSGCRMIAGAHEQISLMVAIGIDVGTTFCCVAVYRDNKVETIKNERGNYTTPSYVAFTQNEILAGEGAKNQASKNVKNTIYHVKRIIGRSSEDEFLKDCIAKSPYKVVQSNEKVKIEVQFKNKTEQYYPEQITAMLLHKLKTDAEEYLNSSVEDVVITVPAAFDNNQRQCTIDAAKIAGLNVLRLLNEPTAAAIAYGLDQNRPDGHNILVYDLGGGTFDVSILRKQGSEFTVLTSVGDPNLGGEDFDALFLDHCIAEFERRNVNCNLKQFVGGNNFHLKDRDKGEKAISILRTECEGAKISLSSTEMASIDIEYLYKGKDFSYNVSRAGFENMCASLFNKTLEILRRALLNANLEKKEVHDVVMIGGSTRIPYITSMVEVFFDRRDVKRNVSPDEAVAHGAARLAFELVRQRNEGFYELVLIERTSHSLGVRTQKGKMEVLIPRGSRYPFSNTKFFTTSCDNQPEVEVIVYEGENTLVTANNKLGSFMLTGIPPVSRGVPEIEIKFEIDADGVLKVSGKQLSTGSVESIVIKRDHAVLTEEEKVNMKTEFEKIREVDEIERRRKAAKTRLESFAYSIINDSNASNKNRQLCKSAIDWLNENQDMEEIVYTEKLDSLRISCANSD